jgi:hypothetical protein
LAQTAFLSIALSVDLKWIRRINVADKRELIYKDDARKAVLKANPSIAYCINNIKPVDAAEVVHGRWVWDNRFHDYTCSECHNWDLKTPNYCSNCGAQMDLKED